MTVYVLGYIDRGVCMGHGDFEDVQRICPHLPVFISRRKAESWIEEHPEHDDKMIMEMQFLS